MTLSGLMLEDTLATLNSSQSFNKIIVVTGDPTAKAISIRRNAVVVWQEKDTGVNSAVSLGNAYGVKAGAQATVVMPQDLPLMSAKDISDVCSLAANHPYVAICPSLRFDGTNALLRNPPQAIPTYYDNNSYENHIKAAMMADIPVKVIDSKNMMFDLDTPEDVRDLANIPDSMISAKSSVSFIKSRLSDSSM